MYDFRKLFNFSCQNENQYSKIDLYKLLEEKNEKISAKNTEIARLKQEITEIYEQSLELIDKNFVLRKQAIEFRYRAECLALAFIISGICNILLIAHHLQ